jgi:hypothetical protein
MTYKLTFMDDKTGMGFDVRVTVELVTKVIQAMLTSDFVLTGLAEVQG